MRSTATGEHWPALEVAEWADTRDTLHMWTQIIGKLRLARAPAVNHWWHVPLYVSARGLTTSAIPCEHGMFDIEFDFIDHQLHIRTSTGARHRINLEPKSVAAFYAEVTAALHALGIDIDILARPVEVDPAIPFAEDTTHATYDRDHAHDFWRQLLAADRVLNRFRASFVGKASPVHFFWGAMDLAYTRFSGRPAPPHPGGAPNCADWVMVEGYSHELASTGFWPGGSAEGSFYAYAYPEPDGYAETPIRPEAGYYDPDVHEFLLPYEVVRTADDPDTTVLEFLRSTYEAAADPGWDRENLEARPARRTSAD
ncbi:DUF5996 family protein [Nocardia flavorosea]|uniref:Ava_C0101 and related proteins n=1 Tax=Nocardia flavorosea TaxID=53429 RepID=A0A846YKH7_9NOCA|nr:DUF5996 family protein [Nocardia flavorosea]NKY58271.1 hypothetical protein [Nocardia flavorosea]